MMVPPHSFKPSSVRLGARSDAIKSSLIRWRISRRSRRDGIPNALGRRFARFRYAFAPPAVAGAIGAALGRLSVVVGASDFPLRYFSGCFLRHVGLLVAAIDSRRAISTIGPGADPFRFAHIV
jgi:hypothetical protein